MKTHENAAGERDPGLQRFIENLQDDNRLLNPGYTSDDSVPSPDQAAQAAAAFAARFTPDETGESAIARAVQMAREAGDDAAVRDIMRATWGYVGTIGKRHTRPFLDSFRETDAADDSELLMALGTACRTMGKHDAALAHFDRARVISSNESDAISLHFAKINLANCYSDLSAMANEPKDAVVYFNEAERLFLSTLNSLESSHKDSSAASPRLLRALAVAFDSYAVLCNRMDNPADATARANEALGLAERLGDQYGIAYANRTLGIANALLAESQLSSNPALQDQARRDSVSHFSRALDIFADALGDPYSRACTLRSYVALLNPDTVLHPAGREFVRIFETLNLPVPPPDYPANRAPGTGQITENP